MRTKFIILMILLSVSLLPMIPTTAQEVSAESTPPAPVFISMNNTGNPEGTFYYNVNMTISLTYQADRFQTQGLVLLGSGSGLTEDISDTGNLVHFKKVSSHRDKTTYEVDLQITNYTYFYAYAWYNSLTNGTEEDYSRFSGELGHQLWISKGPDYPDFVESGINATLRDDDSYYAQINDTVTIQYQMKDPYNITEPLTIVFAENSTALYNTSMSFRMENMTKIDYTVGSSLNHSIYEYNYTMDRSIVYFSAFNQYGWERADFNEPNFHLLTNGFVFNETFSESLDLITTLDNISFNITTYNQTDDMSVGYQYRYFNTSDSEEPLIDWQVFDNLSNITYSLANSSANGYLAINSTEVRTYTGLINQKFEADNLVQLQSFVRYGDGSNISLAIRESIILDPTPILTISSRNETITNGINGTVSFSFSTPKGEISTAELTHFLPNGQVRGTPVDISNLENYTASFSVSDTNDTILEGNHLLSLNVTNSLNQSVVKTYVFKVDRTPPTVSFEDKTAADAAEGYITISLAYLDEGDFPSGVKLVTVDWGNNIVINATGRTTVSMQYRASGTYTIIMTVVDVAGNEATFSQDVSVTITPPSSSTTNGAPLPGTLVFISFFMLVAIVTRKRRN